MNTYVILRRSGWRSPEEVHAAANRSVIIADDEMSDDVRFIRSYVLDEGDGLGTVGIYEATSAEALEEHADRAILPFDEIIPVADTLIMRPDPVGA